jgi:hypothetical protein
MKRALFATNEKGHTLDLVMSLPSENQKVNVVDVDRSVSSDHFAVIVTADCTKPSLPKRNVDVSKWKKINVEQLNRKLSLLDIAPIIAAADDPSAA